jgi:hypothetical protein
LGVRSIGTVLSVVLLVQGMRAQRMDSIPDYLANEAVPIVKLDMRGSFISNEVVQFAGVKLGLEHAGVFQYGIGYSFLLSPVRNERAVAGQGLVGTRLRFGYVTPYIDYAFHRKGPWELRLPVQFGLGSGSVVYDDRDGRTRRLERSFVFLYEPGITVQYRFLRYFGLGAGWGYRLVLRRTNLNEGLTAPIYMFGLRVFFGDLWRDLRPGD